MSPVLAGVLQLLALIARARPGVPSRSATTWPRVYSSDKHLRVEKWIYKAHRRQPGHRDALARLSARRPRLLRRQRPLPLPAAARPGRPARLARLRLHRPRTRRSTPPRPSSPTPTGSRTTASRPWATSCRPAGSRCRTSSRPPSASPSRWPWSAGFARSRTGELGNFWADLVRGTVRILLPLAVIARDRAGRLRRDPELRRHPRGRPVHGRHPAVERRRGRLAGGHQGARHQRRRLLQRQLRPPLREPRRRSPTSSRSS